MTDSRSTVRSPMLAEEYPTAAAQLAIILIPDTSARRKAKTADQLPRVCSSAWLYHAAAGGVDARVRTRPGPSA